MPERLKGPVCKTGGICLRRFESCFVHIDIRTFSQIAANAGNCERCGFVVLVIAGRCGNLLHRILQRTEGPEESTGGQRLRCRFGEVLVGRLEVVIPRHVFGIAEPGTHDM